VLHDRKRKFYCMDYTEDNFTTHIFHVPNCLAGESTGGQVKTKWNFPLAQFGVLGGMDGDVEQILH